MAGRERSLYERLRRAGNGMLNAFQFVGPLYGVDYAKGTLTLGLHPSDERRSIEISLKNIVLPRSIKPGQRIRVNGYVRGLLLDGARRIQFHAISVRDCLDLSHFDETAQQQWKRDVLNAQKGDGQSFRVDDETFSSIRHNFYNPGHVGLEGFIDALYYERKDAGEDGTPGTPCLFMSLRQFENTDLSVPLRLYGRRREALASVRTLMDLFKQAQRRGRLFPVQINGRAEVEIKDVPAQTDEGEEPGVVTRITPIIKVEGVRMIAPDDYVRFLPHEVVDRDTGDVRIVDSYPWASAAVSPVGAGPALDEEGDDAKGKAGERETAAA